MDFGLVLINVDTFLYCFLLNSLLDGHGISFAKLLACDACRARGASVHDRVIDIILVNEFPHFGDGDEGLVGRTEVTLGCCVVLEGQWEWFIRGLSTHFVEVLSRQGGWMEGCDCILTYRPVGSSVVKETAAQLVS